MTKCTSCFVRDAENKHDDPILSNAATMQSVLQRLDYLEQAFAMMIGADEDDAGNPLAGAPDEQSPDLSVPDYKKPGQSSSPTSDRASRTYSAIAAINARNAALRRH